MSWSAPLGRCTSSVTGLNAYLAKPLRSVYLLFEFWRLEEPGPDGTIRVDSRRMANVYFLVARGLQPNVSGTGKATGSALAGAFCAQSVPSHATHNMYLLVLGRPLPRITQVAVESIRTASLEVRQYAIHLHYTRMRHSVPYCHPVQVTYTSSEVLYSPPRASQPQLGQSGALQDEAADSAWRPYHRILVPTDANVTLPRPGASPQTLDWCVLGISINTTVLGRAPQGQHVVRDCRSSVPD